MPVQALRSGGYCFHCVCPVVQLSVPMCRANGEGVIMIARGLKL